LVKTVFGFEGGLVPLADRLQALTEPETPDTERRLRLFVEATVIY
jgi:hypothetical protein